MPSGSERHGMKPLSRRLLPTLLALAVAPAAAADLFVIAHRDVQLSREEVAEVYRGERLHAMGAIHRLGHLDDALAWAGELAALAPLSLTGHKIALEAIAAGRSDDPAAAAAKERAWASDDAAEGRQAFLEKRTPEFRGR